MALFPWAPIPVENTKGESPTTKAKDVIRIGRNLALAPSKAALFLQNPARRLCRANSTIRIAFLANSPISIINPIWKNTLFSEPAKYVMEYAPKTPCGIEKIPENGIKKLSYCAAKKKSTKRTTKIYINVVCAPDDISSLVRPE